MLVTVARFLDPWEAHIVCGRLQADGILASVAFANHAIVNWPMAYALGGTAVQVPEDYLDQSRELLAAYHSGELGLDAPETRQVPEGHCPVCWSTDLQPVIRWHQRLLVVLLGFFGATFPTGSDEVKCGACGYRTH
jgi:hypothetical protein